MNNEEQKPKDMTQSAVEWFAEKVEQHLLTFGSIQPNVLSKFKQEAKAMEKEQIIDSFDEGKSDGYKTAREWDEMIVWLSAEQYYNKTYGGNK